MAAIQQLSGLVLTDSEQVLFALGVGCDETLQRQLLSDQSDEDSGRRLVSVERDNQQFVGCVVHFEDKCLTLLNPAPGDAVLRFFSNVDFAYDIIEHILTDPFEALNIVDADERLVFMSPVHEKYMGLKTGEGEGKPVQEVIENTRLHQVVRTGIAEVGQVQHFKNFQRIVSRYPIRKEGEVVGAIGRIMFKGPEQLESLARRINQLEAEVARYKEETARREQDDEILGMIVGESVAVRDLRAEIAKIAPLDIPVLIQGDSGTGKELVVRALHHLSGRAKGPLVAVNAAALPEALVESELFGYAPGSFTGADRKGRKGKFELADHGTLFLDEIGDMPLEVQAKLLRVLQDKNVERIGDARTRPVDFRLCCATNHDLEAFVESEKFRLDLFYRVSPIAIRVPSLAERLEDIPLLVNYFLKQLSRQYDKLAPGVVPDVYDYLMAQRWPGNIRQLEHEVERAFHFAENGRIEVTDFGHSAPQVGSDPLPAGKVHVYDASGEGATLRDQLERVEDRLIAEAMERNKGNKKKVAEQLGISRSYLYKKLELASQQNDETGT